MGSKRSKKIMKKERKQFSKSVKGTRNINKVPKDNQLILNKDGGLFFGMKEALGSYRYVGRFVQEDGHCLTIGGPSCGKTEGPVKATLCTWISRLVFIDIKGGSDGLEKWRHHFHPKRRLKVFNPTKFDTAHFDPYRFLKYCDEKNLARYARDLAHAILPIPPDIGVNKVWTRLAQNLLTAAIIYYYSIGSDFNQTMLAVQNHSVQQLVKTIINSCDETAIDELTHGIISNSAKRNRIMLARLFASKIEGLKSEVKAGIGMDFGEFIALAVDPFIKSAFDTTDETADMIDWNDFLSDENDYDVLLQIPEYMLEQWEPMIALMLTQLFDTLEQRPEEHSPDALPPLLILLDEFPRLGKCDTVKNALATLRSRGVTLSLFVQSLAQLDERYGQKGRKVVLGCCSYKLLLGVAEPDDQEYFSREIGETPVIQSQISVNCDPKGEVISRNFSFCEGKKRLVAPEELGYMKDESILITPEGPCRIDKAFCHDPEFFKCLVRPAELPRFCYELGIIPEEY